MDDFENDPQIMKLQPSVIPLSAQVEQAVELYFSQLKGHETANLYNLVIREVEKSLLATVLKHSDYNQTKATKILGLSRSTLRKKIARYQLS